MSEMRVPGVSLAVIHRANLAARRAYGVTDVATRKPVEHSAIFEADSMSKPVFAYVVLKLCEKGILGLDTPLSKYAPKPFLTGDPRLDLITPRHILAHTSGFPNWRSGDEPIRIHFAPGSQYRYSGEGYYYLQSVITHLCGKTFTNDCSTFEDGLEVCATDISDFMRRNALEPFGMQDSGYLLSERQTKAKATGHSKDGERFAPVAPTGPSVTRYAAAGALCCTATDYANFMLEVLNPKKPDEFRLKPETISEMLRPHVKVVNGAFTSSWALGWQVQDNGLINHGGDNKGFHSHALANPKSKSGFVVMTNGDRGPELIQKLFVLPELNPFLEVPS